MRRSMKKRRLVRSFNSAEPLNLMRRNHWSLGMIKFMHGCIYSHSHICREKHLSTFFGGSSVFLLLRSCIVEVVV